MLFSNEEFFEVAIESCPESDLNPSPLNSVRTLQPTELSTRTQSQLCTATPISSFVQCHLSFRLLPSSIATFVLM